MKSVKCCKQFIGKRACSGIVLLYALSCLLDWQPRLLAEVPPARAAVPVPTSGPAVASPQLPTLESTVEYVLGPEDQVSIHVQDLEELSNKITRVDPNGSMDLPLVGSLHAGGLTVEQFKTELSKKLGRFIHEPKIDVSVTEYRSQPVSVIGAVTSPGVHQLEGPKHLIDVLSLAGGIRPDAGPRLVITRQKRWGPLPLPDAQPADNGQASIAELSIDELTSLKNPADNILVRPNDVISVLKGNVVYVVGDVKKAGSYPLTSHESISLLQALSMAEGLDHDAAPKKAKILRAAVGTPSKVDEIPVNIQSIFDGKTPDVQLRPNDVLFVPDSLSKSSVRRAAEAALQVATGVVVYRR